LFPLFFRGRAHLHVFFLPEAVLFPEEILAPRAGVCRPFQKLLFRFSPALFTETQWFPLRLCEGADRPDCLLRHDSPRPHPPTLSVQNSSCFAEHPPPFPLRVFVFKQVSSGASIKSPLSPISGLIRWTYVLVSFCGLPFFCRSFCLPIHALPTKIRPECRPLILCLLIRFFLIFSSSR